MFLRPFGLYCSACFGSLFVSIFCTFMTLFVVTDNGDCDVVGCQTVCSAHFVKPNGATVYV